MEANMENTSKWQLNARLRSAKILTAALKLFCEKGIEDTSIEDVAKEAGVGPATIYRYFETKAELAIQTGIAYWQKVSGNYLGILAEKPYCEGSGKKQMEQIFAIFLRIFTEEFDFLKFLQEFDVFVQKYQISMQRLAEYDNTILNLKSYVTDALNKGLADGSLNFSYSVDEIYFSVMHTMLSLMQKLASNGKILSSDERIDLTLQVKIAGELLIRGLSA